MGISEEIHTFVSYLVRDPSSLLIAIHHQTLLSWGAWETQKWTKRSRCCDWHRVENCLFTSHQEGDSAPGPGGCVFGLGIIVTFGFGERRRTIQSVGKGSHSCSCVRGPVPAPTVWAGLVQGKARQGKESRQSKLVGRGGVREWRWGGSGRGSGAARDQIRFSVHFMGSF